MAGAAMLIPMMVFSFLYLLKLLRHSKIIFESMQRKSRSRDKNLSIALTSFYAQHIWHLTKAIPTEHTGLF